MRIVFLVLAMLLFSVQVFAATYAPGVYTASMDGNGGKVTVEVVFTADTIQSVTVTEQKETPGIGEKAVTKLPSAIVEAQSTEVDGVSGASYTSKAIKAAVDDCILQATNKKVAVKSAAAIDTMADVVIVGAGGAGLSAAYYAKAYGADKVILLEKRGVTGGNTARAGFFAAGGTSIHRMMGIDYQIEDQYRFLMDTPKTNPETARVFVNNATTYVEWLVNDVGIKVGRVVGREFYAEAGKTKFPAQMISRLTELNESAGVDIRLNNRAADLLERDGVVYGVRVESPEGTYIIEAKAVILTSGGFSSGKELLVEFAPGWEDRSTSNTSATTGDGIIMARKIGAQLSNMSEFTFNPTFHDYRGTTMSVSGVRYEGGILVSRKGKRFANEMANYSVVAMAEMKLPEQSAFAIMDANSLGTNPYYCEKADTLEELADKLGIDKKNLIKTVEKYRKSYDKGRDSEFGRTDMRSRLDSGPYYGLDVFPGVHHTRGGILASSRGEVLDTSGRPIPGLYAAGEVADMGLMGNDSAAAGAVFGKIAAEAAVTDTSKLY